MKMPHYISLKEARRVLGEMGIELSQRQMQRAAEADTNGRRKLPFFRDPVQGTLKIEKGSLVDAYRKAQIDAENNLQD